MKILSIDAGTTESAYTVIDTETMHPISFAKMNNYELLEDIFPLISAERRYFKLAKLELFSFSR